MATVQGKKVPHPLRTKANEFLNSKQHANNLSEILDLFNVKVDNYTPVLLTIDVIFTKLLERGDLVQEIIPLQLTDPSPKAQYKKWLLECYEKAVHRILKCFKIGCTASRIQALSTACKLMQAEGRWPIESTTSYFFPATMLTNILAALLDSEASMSVLISRFQEYTEYRDVQQFGLKILYTLAHRESELTKKTDHKRTRFFMQNYLELLDKLLIGNFKADKKMKNKDRGTDTDTNEKVKVLCTRESAPQFTYRPIAFRRYANRCWSYACQWQLYSDGKTLRLALMLLVERMMPLLTKPELATDLLCDSLDRGGAISILALQGVLDLVRCYNINYPHIYDRLYAMYEPTMFAARYKRRLVHLTDVFLSSTHLPESLVAAFAKRLSRLALMASGGDATALLQLVANLLHRHPALKRMVCHEETPALMSSDPYILDESCASNSRALNSFLWEVAALKRHHLPAVASAAQAVLANVDQRAGPVVIKTVDDDAAFDAELKKRFKTIEMNFVRPRGMALLPSGERLQRYFDLTV